MKYEIVPNTRYSGAINYGDYATAYKAYANGPGLHISAKLPSSGESALRYKAVSGTYKVGTTDDSFVEVNKKMKNFRLPF